MWLSPGSCAATFPGVACKINKVRGWRGVPAISRQNVHKLTHCLSLIWRIIPLPPSTHFCQYLHPLQNGIVIQCFQELLQQQFQEQLVSKIDCQIKDGIFDLGTYSVNGKYIQIEVEFL